MIRVTDYLVRYLINCLSTWLYRSGCDLQPRLYCSGCDVAISHSFCFVTLSRVESRHIRVLRLFTFSAFLSKTRHYTQTSSFHKTSIIILTGYEPGPVQYHSRIHLHLIYRNFILGIADSPIYQPRTSTPHFATPPTTKKNVFQQRPVVEDLLHVEVWSYQEVRWHQLRGMERRHHYDTQHHERPRNRTLRRTRTPGQQYGYR